MGVMSTTTCNPIGCLCGLRIRQMKIRTGLGDIRRTKSYILNNVKAQIPKSKTAFSCIWLLLGIR